VGYTLADEIKTWPITQSLSDFARRSCSPLAKITISDYFDLLWPRFLELKQRVNDVVFSAETELVQLTDRLVQYQKSFETSDNFVRYVK